MDTITLQGTDLSVSKICLGCARMGTYGENPAPLLDRYYDRGGRFFNTARVYGDEPGLSEQCLGAWIRERGIRDRVVLTSKCGEEDGLPALHAETLLRHIDESLCSTGLDYLDFYLLHVDDPAVPVGEILDAMAEMRRAGKIRYYGCSNWSVERQREAAIYADAHGLPRFVMDEIEMSVARNNAVNRETIPKWLDETYISYHRESERTVGAYSPTTSGALLQYLRDGDTRNWNARFQKVYRNPYNDEVVRRLAVLSRETGCSPAQIQLAWILARPYGFPCFPIIGPRNVDELNDSLGALDCPMTAEMVDYLIPKEVATSSRSLRKIGATLS